MVKLWRRCGQQNNEKQIVKETIIKSGETPTENYNDRDYNCVENYENCDDMITIMLTIMTILGGYYEEGMADDFWLLTSHCAESQNHLPPLFKMDIFTIYFRSSRSQNTAMKYTMFTKCFLCVLFVKQK